MSNAPALPALTPCNVQIAWDEALQRSDLMALLHLMQDRPPPDPLDAEAYTRALALAGQALVPPGDRSAPDESARSRTALATDLMVRTVVAGANPFRTQVGGLGSSFVFSVAVTAPDPTLGERMIHAAQAGRHTPSSWALPALARTHRGLLPLALEQGWVPYREEDRQDVWHAVIQRVPFGEASVAQLAGDQVALLHALHRHHAPLGPSSALDAMAQVIANVARPAGENRAQRTARQLRLMDTLSELGLEPTPNDSTRLLAKALAHRAPMVLVQRFLAAGADVTGLQDKLVERERIELRETMRTVGVSSSPSTTGSPRPRRRL